jgi:hypothetical protein
LHAGIPNRIGGIMFSKPQVSKPQLRRPLAVAVSALALLALSACGMPGSSPSPSGSPGGSSSSSPSPSATPTEEPAPEAVTVHLTALTVTVIGDDGSTMADLPYYATDAATAVAALTEALGTPVTSSIAASSCTYATTKYDWGGIILADPAATTAVAGAHFSIYLTAAATPGGVILEGPSGVTVGMTTAAALAAAPGTSHVDLGSGFGEIPLDAGDSSSAINAWGTVAYTNGGVVNSIDSPVYHYGEC